MNSLWNNTVSLPPHPILERDLQTDVLIIGGGICGLLCAYTLAQEGVDCALVEAGRICCRTSGNTTAKITFQHGLIYHKLIKTFGQEMAAMYLEANRSALERYRALCRDANCDFESNAAVVYAIDTPEALEQEHNAYHALGIQFDIFFLPGCQSH